MIQLLGNGAIRITFPQYKLANNVNANSNATVKIK